MASREKIFIVISVFLASLASGISGKMQCEDLPMDLCAFSVSSAGSRCLLEKKITTDGDVDYECLTSQVGASEYAEWVETDECMQACGLERMSVGMASDSLVEKGFVRFLCSAACQNNCPNVVDFFSSMSAGEGVHLKQVCEKQTKAPRRELGEGNFASSAGSSVREWDLSHSSYSMGPRAAMAPSGSALFTAPALSPAPALHV